MVERCRWRSAGSDEGYEASFNGFDLLVFRERDGWHYLIRHEGWLALDGEARPSLAAAKRWARGVALHHASDLRATARALARETRAAGDGGMP